MREASAEIGNGRNSGVRVALARRTATCTGTMTGSISLLDGDMSLAPLVERACAAAERWRQTASKSVRGIAATCQVRPDLREEGDVVDRGVPDLAPLRSACMAWLSAAGPVQASFGPHGRSMHVEIGGPDGAKVGSPWADRDPTEDRSVLAEAERLHREVGPTGVAWTLCFSDDFAES